MRVRSGALITAISILAWAWGLPAAEPARPNILFVMTDQQPISTIGAYGNRQIKTPHIDRLAREGIRFNDTTRYWTFVQVLGPGMRVILTRATLWPDPPTTTWRAGTRRLVGPLRVPVLPNMQESYPVRVGLYSPETKTRPAVLGEAHRIAGTLTVRKSPDGRQQVSFQAEK
jgi:hypothetical protein